MCGFAHACKACMCGALFGFACVDLLARVQLGCELRKLPKRWKKPTRLATLNLRLRTAPPPRQPRVPPLREVSFPTRFRFTACRSTASQRWTLPSAAHTVRNFITLSIAVPWSQPQNLFSHRLAHEMMVKQLECSIDISYTESGACHSSAAGGKKKWCRSD